MATERPQTADEARAKRIIECVEIFNSGCSIAGPQAHSRGIGRLSPAGCPECLVEFLKQVALATKGWSPPGLPVKPSGPMVYQVETGADVWPRWLDTFCRTIWKKFHTRPSGMGKHLPTLAEWKARRDDATPTCPNCSCYLRAVFARFNLDSRNIWTCDKCGEAYDAGN